MTTPTKVCVWKAEGGTYHETEREARLWNLKWYLETNPLGGVCHSFTPYLLDYVLDAAVEAGLVKHV